MKILTFAFLTLASSLFTLSFAHATELDIAPNWQLTTQDGESITLNQFHGKPVILHFWATWCPYCKKLQPVLVEMQNKYADADVTIVGISFNEDEGAMPQDELNSRGYNFVTAVNGSSVAELYGVSGTPTTFYLGRKGQVIYRSSSSDITDPRIELAIQEIIK